MHSRTADTSRLSRLGDYTTTSRVLVLAVMAIATGSFGVASAWVLLRLIALVTGIAYYGELSTRHGIVISLAVLGNWSILVPVVGSLIVGLMARYGSEKIRGHGIPEALEAILIGESRIDAKVTVLKPLSSAIAIGTGGPFGAEGPIIMTGGALGSLFAQLFRMSGAERKTLLVAGAAAGMTAVFGTPIAAVLLSVELLLFEWKPRSFIPVLVACITASVERVWLLPATPLFPHVSAFPIDSVSLLLCCALGIICGIASGLLTGLVYAAEDAFGLLPIHWMWWPAIGGLVVGLGGLINPSALGVGYVIIDRLLNGNTPLDWTLKLLFVKAIIWAVALGSGTSGGVLAPLLIMGGGVGALFGRVLPNVGPGDWALIGMAATMGGTMRAPLTAMMFAVELTGDGHMAIPLLTACGASYAFTVLVLKRSILTEKLARRGRHITREYSVDPLELALVRDVMVAPVETVPGKMRMSELIHFFGSDRATHKTYPIVDDVGRVIGLASRSDALAAVETAPHADPPLSECLGGRAFPTAQPDEPVAALVARMVQSEAGRVPVIREDGKLVGMVARSDLLRVRARLLMEEEHRQSYVGWRRHKQAA
ncbi:MAG TPA: chloride channel protein [Acetobacteraceae bacterium]|nr:chloride channel protein [Acetobacteraceae bacterium]